MSSEAQSETWPVEALARIASLQKTLALVEDALFQERERAKLLEAERDRVRAAYQELLIAIELLRHRIEAAKAERIDTQQLELEFEAKCRELDALSGALVPKGDSPPAGEPSDPPAGRPRSKPAGRRDLSDDASLPEERIEVTDPEMERLVAEGKAERFGFDEESSKVRHRRASKVRLVIVRVKYRLGKLEGAQDSSAAKTDVDVAESSTAAVTADDGCDAPTGDAPTATHDEGNGEATASVAPASATDAPVLGAADQESASASGTLTYHHMTAVSPAFAA